MSCILTAICLKLQLNVPGQSDFRKGRRRLDEYSSMKRRPIFCEKLVSWPEIRYTVFISIIFCIEGEVDVC